MVATTNQTQTKMSVPLFTCVCGNNKITQLVYFCNYFFQNEKKGKDARVPRLRSEVHPMTRLLRGYHLNGENLSGILRCTPPTARKKIDNPGRLTLDDLSLIHRVVGIPLDEIRGAIR